MFQSLDKQLTESEDDEFEPDHNAQIQALREQLNKAKITLTQGTLFGLKVIEILGRIIEQYLESNTSFMSSGFANLAWSARKKELAQGLIPTALKILSESNTGENFRDNLYTELNAFSNEFLPAQRAAFGSSPKEPPLGIGKLEKDYLPMMERSLEIIYEIYRLHQIDNKTNRDKSSDETVLLAAGFAEYRVTQLFPKKITNESLSKAEAILKEIKKAYDKSLLVSAAAAEAEKNTAATGGTTGVRPVAPVIHLDRLLAVMNSFADQMKSDAERANQEAVQAMANKLTAAINSMVSLANSTVGLAGTLSTQITEMMLTLYMGSLNGPSDITQDYVEISVPMKAMILHGAPNGDRPPPPPPSSSTEQVDPKRSNSITNI